MKYEMHVLERIVLSQVLAGAHTNGSYIFHKAIEKARADLSLGEKESKDIGLEYDGKQVTWKGDVEKTVEIPPSVLKIIRDELKRLDEAEQLSPEHVPVYEMFMEKEDEPGTKAKSS